MDVRSGRAYRSRISAAAVVVVSACVLVTGVGMSPAMASQPAHAKHKPRPTELSIDEHALTHWVNAQRLRAHLVPVGLSQELSTVARKQSERMVTSHRVFHNPHLSTDVHSWESVGENVGSGRGLTSLEHAMLADPIARANLLGPGFRQIGAGVRIRHGLLYVTIVVRRPAQSVRH
jgi:uncharacterized protein YkwD